MSADDAPDLGGVLDVVGHEPARPRRRRDPDHHRVAAREALPSMRMTPAAAGSAPAQRRHGAGIDGQDAFRLERARDPFLARCHRIGRREEPGAARPPAMACSGWATAGGDHHACRHA